MPDTQVKTYDALLRKFSTLVVLALVALALGAALVVVIGRYFWDQVRPLVSNQLPLSVIIIVVCLGLILLGCAASLLAERTIAGFIQDRYGTSRVGSWVRAQVIA